MGFIHKLEEKIENVLDRVGSILFFLMLISTFFNIFSYWFTKKRFAEFDEIVISFFVWVVYISCGPLYMHNGHIGVSFVVEGMRPLARAITRVLIDVLVFVVSAFVIYYTWKLMMRSFTKYTQVLKLPYAFIDLGVLFGYFSLFVAAIAKVIIHINELLQTIKGKEVKQA